MACETLFADWHTPSLFTYFCHLCLWRHDMFTAKCLRKKQSMPTNYDRIACRAYVLIFCMLFFGNLDPKMCTSCCRFATYEQWALGAHLLGGIRCYQYRPFRDDQLQNRMQMAYQPFNYNAIRDSFANLSHVLSGRQRDGTLFWQR